MVIFNDAIKNSEGKETKEFDDAEGIFILQREERTFDIDSVFLVSLLVSFPVQFIVSCLLHFLHSKRRMKRLLKTYEMTTFRMT